MEFSFVEPEVAGGVGERSRLDTSVHPPVVEHLEYEFDGWLGDVLVEGFPVFVITAAGAAALRQAGATGVSFEAAEVTTSEQFADLYPGRTMPAFVRLVPSGQAGRDDFGIAEDLRLVVSNRAIAVLAPFGLTHAIIEPFDGS